MEGFICFVEVFQYFPVAYLLISELVNDRFVVLYLDNLT